MYLMSGFNPNKLNCNLWFNGGTKVTLASNRVYTWGNLSSLGTNATQNTSGQRPYYDTSLNGIKGVRFTAGTASYMSASSVLGAFKNIYGMSVFCVFQCTDSDMSDQHFFFVSDKNYNYSAQTCISLNYGAAGDGYCFVGKRTVNDGITYCMSNSAIDTDPHIMSVIIDYQNTSVYIYVDGTQVASNLNFCTSGLSDNSNAKAIYLGGVNPLSGYFCANMYELITFNKALSNIDRKCVEHYLAKKFNLTVST